MTTLGRGDAGNYKAPSEQAARPPPPPPPSPSPENDFLRELGVTRQQAYCIGAAALLCGGMMATGSSTSAGGGTSSSPSASSGGLIRMPVNVVSMSLLALAGTMLLVPAPSEQSFTGYFKTWFLDRYMNAAGKSYRDYLKTKSKREDGLQKLGTTITRWFHKATEDINNTLFYELSVKHALPHAYRFNILEGFRLVQVNLGSPSRPAWFTFVGLCRVWWWLPVVWTEGRLVFDLTLAVADGGLLNYAVD